jgi:hypothetical protein
MRTLMCVALFVIASGLTPALCSGATVVGTPVLSTIDAFHPPDAQCPQVPPKSTTRFVVGDPYITLWVRLSVSAGESIQVEFTDPSQRVNHAFDAGNAFDKPGVVAYCTSPLTLPGPSPMPGQWSVTAYLNHQRVPLFPPLFFTLRGQDSASRASLDPNLVSTMKYIQDTLNSIGKFEWAVVPVAEGSDLPTVQYSEQISEAVADPRACTLSFRRAFQSGPDSATKIPLRSLKNAVAKPQDLLYPYDPRKPNGIGGEAIQKFVPPHYAVQIELSGRLVQIRQEGRVSATSTEHFKFPDEDSANNFAKALIAAVDLCGEATTGGGDARK